MLGQSLVSSWDSAGEKQVSKPKLGFGHQKAPAEAGAIRSSIGSLKAAMTHWPWLGGLFQRDAQAGHKAHTP